VLNAEPESLGLSAEDSAQLVPAVEQFEDAWEKGRRPAIDDYLPADGRLRQALLVKLTHVDLERRLVAGEAARVEDYLHRYPELSAARAAVLGLIAAEGELRRRQEPDLSFAEYAQRFPDYVADLPTRLQFLPHKPPSAGSASSLGPTWKEDGPAAPAGTDPAAVRPQAGLPAIPGYEVLEALGEGGMGQVFKARHLGLDRLVALKLIRSDRLSKREVVRRFQREARAAAKLTHPNIVTVHDYGEVGDTQYLAMEFLQGIDLSQLVKESGPLPVAEACDCVRQAALGLQHVHERGLVHRDIKPANLFRTAPDGVVKILDLGLARLEHLTPPEHPSSELTQVGTVIGTPAYIAPEQATDSHHADIRADIYSLGCTLYFLLAGQPPFRPGSLAMVLLQHQLEEPPPLEAVRPDVPAAVAGIVRKMMAKRPADRYQTPAEVAAALAPFCDLAAQPAPPSGESRAAPAAPTHTAPGPASPVAGRVGPRPARRLWGVAFLLAAVPAAGVLGWLALSQPWPEHLPATGPDQVRETSSSKPSPAGPNLAGRVNEGEVPGAKGQPAEAHKGPKEAERASPDPAAEKRARGEQALRDVQDRLARAATPSDFAELLAKCDQAPDMPLVRACRAECLVEQRAGKPAPEDLESAQALVDDQTVAAVGPYGHYVRALVKQAATREPPTGAANELVLAFAEAPLPAPLSGPRRERAVRILDEAARGVRRKGTRAQPFQTPELAGQAFLWLQKADALANEAGQAPSTERLVNLVLAAWHKPERDRETVQRGLAVLSPRLDPNTLDKADAVLRENAYPLLLLAAGIQPKTPQGERARFDSYVKALTVVEKKVAEVEPLRLYEEALNPAIDAGEKLSARDKNPQLDRDLARSYYQRGQLVYDHDYLEWPFSDARQEALDNFRQAAELDPATPRYLVWRAYARSQLPNPDWDDLELTARRAIELEPKSPGGWGLLGRVLLLHSRASPADRIPQLKQALEALLRAEELLPEGTDSDQLRPILLLNTSLVHLELGNYIADVGPRREHLYAALRYAEDVQKRNRHSYPEYVWEARGNTLEDIAWIVGEKDKYDRAIEAFRRAVAVRRDRPHARIALARCLFRAVTDGGQPPSLLDDAEDNLLTALNKKPDPRDYAEACFWYGRIWARRAATASAGRAELYQKAQGYFAKVAEGGRGVSDWAEEALVEQVKLALEQAAGKPPADAVVHFHEARATVEKLRVYRPSRADEWLKRVDEQRADTALATKDVGTALRLADEIEALGDGPLAAHFRGLAFRLGRRFEQALAAYDKAHGPALRALQREGVQRVVLAGALKFYPPALSIGGPAANDSAILLVLERADFLLSLEAPEKLPRNPAQLVPEADAAAWLARTPALTAHALGTAAQARINAAQRPGFPRAQKRQFQKEAVAKLRQALEIAPHDPRGWMWRLLLGMELKDLLDRESPANPAALRKEAILRLEEALQDKDASKASQQIRDLLSELTKRRTP
jgi:tRNA A-37 threonylcarbamoyl transferase component Bud32